METESRSMLNVFEVEDDQGNRRHIVCYIDAMRAGVEGINPRTIIGDIPLEVSINPSEFRPETFRLNPGFVECVTEFLNEYALGDGAEALAEQAKSITTGWLYVVDPRFQTPDTDPGPENLIGAYAVDETGQIVPGGFLYNENHRFFDPEAGVSGLLQSQHFFDWLNPPVDL